MNSGPSVWLKNIVKDKMATWTSGLEPNTPILATDIKDQESEVNSKTAKMDLLQLSPVRPQ